MILKKAIVNVILKQQHTILVVLALMLSACSSPDEQDRQLGLIEVDAPINKTAISFENQVKPIFDSRCVACHACYDAPCQVKLTAHAGIERGTTKQRVYQHKSLKEGKLSRLFFDAKSESQWREQGFDSILNSPAASDSSSQAQRFSSLLGMLELKAKEAPIRSGDAYEVPIDDSQEWQCASNHSEFMNYAHDYPQQGMPYALPSLNEEQANLLSDWVKQGANDDTDYSLTPKEKKLINQWETLLNQPTVKSQLIARYIYEHLFLASLYFGNGEPGRYFQLVRSSTNVGEPVDVIATRRPFDHPGVDKVYYRLRLNKETTVAKTHMPYRLDEAKFDKWQQWFYQADFDVTTLPSYDIKTASNPFITFQELPAESRYRFMLDEANYTVKGFIKGPVCKGQSAVNVINEQFWVFFIDPEYQSGPEMNAFLTLAQNNLDLPAEKEDTLDLFDSWDEFADKEQAFLKQRREFLKRNVNDEGAFNINVLWDGDGTNSNAALTIYRHFDNATVHKGLSGAKPKTVWVIDYPLLERIHYLLVAGYDVYGNISHNLLSRIYMDFLRMEGESLFLLMLPHKQRIDLRKHWYRGADSRIENFLSLTDLNQALEPAIEERTNIASHKAKDQLLNEIEKQLSAVVSSRFDITNPAYQYPKDMINIFLQLQALQSASFDYLPEVTMIEIEAEGQQYYLTMLKNRGHLNNTSILFETLTIEPDETSLTVLPGMVGPRPNAFMTLDISQISDFSRQLQSLETDEDYRLLFDVYGLHRTDPNFWAVFDRFDHGFKKFSNIDYGVLDLNKLENH